MWDHHAYLLIGNRSSWLAKLRADLPSDWFYREAENFSIDQARELKHQQQQAIRAERFLIISFQTITLEAQNALLKTLEEPGQGNHFFLLTNSLRNLLPTLLSRVQVLHQLAEVGTDTGAAASLASKFLASPYEQRLALVAAWLTLDEEEEQRTFKIKQRALDLTQALETELYQALKNKPQDSARALALTNLITYANYLYDQAALPKMILEHLALTLPPI